MPSKDAPTPLTRPTVCRGCGFALKERTAFCPGCGGALHWPEPAAPQMGRRTSSWRWLQRPLVTFVVLFGLGAVVHELHPPKPWGKLTVAHASLDGDAIDVENGDTFPWEHVVVWLNDSYRYEPSKPLPPHHEDWWELANFADASNHRFDVRTTKPRTITIEADTPNGRARHDGMWPDR